MNHHYLPHQFTILIGGDSAYTEAQLVLKLFLLNRMMHLYSFAQKDVIVVYMCVCVGGGVQLACVCICACTRKQQYINIILKVAQDTLMGTINVKNKNIAFFYSSHVCRLQLS